MTVFDILHIQMMTFGKKTKKKTKGIGTAKNRLLKKKMFVLSQISLTSFGP